MNKRKVYIAFDLSLHHTGWAVYAPEDTDKHPKTIIDLGVINTDDAEDELKYLYEHVTEIIKKYSTTYDVSIFKEKQAQQMGGGKTTVKTIVGLAKAHAVCELACSMLGFNCFDVSALTAKVFVVGKGHRDATKEDVMTAVLQQFPTLQFDDFDNLKYDVSDAVAVALTADYSIAQETRDKIKEFNRQLKKYKASVLKRKNKRISEKIEVLESEISKLKENLKV